MPTGGRPTVRSRRLGAALRVYREAAKLDQQHAADHVAGSKTKISRIETGQVAARPGDVRLLLELYGVEDRGVCQQLEQLARAANRRGWWLDFPWAPSDKRYADVLTLETDATYIRTWQPLFIPGLLQTDEYLKALHEASLTVYTAEQTDEMIAIRQARRKLVEEGGCQLAAIIWEPALTAPMSNSRTHLEQLQHIRDVAERQNVSIQVLPLSEWGAAHMTSHFAMYSFGPEPAPEAVAYDTTTSSVVLEDFDDMAKHARIFEALRSSALTPTNTMAFLAKAIDDIPDTQKESA